MIGRFSDRSGGGVKPAMSFKLRSEFFARSGAVRGRAEDPAGSSIPKAGLSRPASVFIAALIFLAANPWSRAFAQNLDLGGMDVQLPQAGSFGGNSYLSGTGNVLNTGITSATLTEGGASAGTVWQGAFIQTAGAISWIHTSGDITLAGVSNLTGGTQILGGMVTIDAGTALGASLVTNSAGSSASMPGLDNSGQLNGGLSNELSGYAKNEMGGTIAGVTNSGYFYNYGSVTAAGLINSGTATNYSGGAIVGVTNSGTFDNQAGGQVTGSLINTSGVTTNEGFIAGGATVSGGTLTTIGTISGGVINSATVNAAGSINGAIQNNGGTFTVTGALTGDGSTTSFTNAGTAQLLVTGGNFTGLTTISNTSAAATGIQVAVGYTLSGQTLTNGSALVSGATIADYGTITLSGAAANANYGTVHVYNGGVLTATGGINNYGTIMVDHGGSVSDVLNNSGLVNNSGSYLADVSNLAGGTINNLSMGSWSGNVISNVSLITNAGVWTGNVLANAGTITNTGSWTGTVTTAGTFNNKTGGSVSGLVTNSGILSNQGGALDGGLTNTGTASGYGSIKGAIQNLGSGTFTVTGGNFAGDGSTASFTNSGKAQLLVTGGNFTGLAAITNTSAYFGTSGGSIQISAGNTLSGTTLVNGAATGAPVTITDAGTLTLSGNVTNYATGVIDVTGTGSLTAASITNLGTIDMAAGASATYYGDLINNSVINMVNGSPNDVMRVYGNYSGDGVLKVDINTFTGQSDQLVISGTALSTNGTTSVYFNVLGNGFVVALPVVLTGKGTDASAFSGSLPDWGTISYSFVPDGNNWVVKSYLNHSFGPLADISGALASVTTVFQQPASSYVGDKSNAKVDELFCGIWARTDFDRLTVHSPSTVTANGAPVAPLSTSQNINYTAIESGLDCGLLRIAGTSWNAHLGLMGGEVDGSVGQTDGLGTTALRTPVLGGYAFLRNGGFVFDFSVRQNFTDAEFTIAQAGLQKTPVDGLATTIAAYTSYTFEVGKDLLLTPYAGLSWTRSQLDDFEIYTNVGGVPTGRVAPNVNELSVGRLGLQLSYVQAITDAFYLRPFAGVSGWDAFQNATSLKYYVTNGTVVDVATPMPKDFMQVEGGLAFAESSIQATGYVKGVYKEGPDIKGESIVLGARLNF